MEHERRRRRDGRGSTRVRLCTTIFITRDQYSDGLHTFQEDMDLLLFSDDPSASLQAQLTQGLPLKAVYCDSLVGFRYLYPRPTPLGSSPVNVLSLRLASSTTNLDWARPIAVSRWTLKPLKLRLSLSGLCLPSVLAPRPTEYPERIGAGLKPR
jgi:hypothetical protein